jgi:hypothetical protein
LGGCSDGRIEMIVTMCLPSDGAVPVSHTAGVTFQNAQPAKPAQSRQRSRVLTSSQRDDVLYRFEHTRNSYASVRAFAREEQERLVREDGVVTTTRAIEVLVGRCNLAFTRDYERLLRLLETPQDVGQLSVQLNRSPHLVRRLIGYAREKGYAIDKWPACRVNYRGWPSVFQLRSCREKDEARRG